MSEDESSSKTPCYYSLKQRKAKRKTKGETENIFSSLTSYKQDERKKGRGGGDKEAEKEEGLKHIPLSSNPQVCLAIYIAMAHAGLALSLAILYGLVKLLEQYWRPIQWAILCSMPLRELQTALVSFWSHALQLGLLETLLAIPLAIFRATTGSVIDSQTALLRLLRRHPLPCNDRVGFPKLMQWVVSCGLFVLAHERIGFAAIPVFIIPGFIAYATGFGTSSAPGVATTLSAISSVRHGRHRVLTRSESSIFRRFSRYLISMVLSRLTTMVGIGLIIIMIVGSISGIVLFSYKIGIEGRDAVVSLKTHLEENDYAERIGLKQWMAEKNVSELTDTYSMKFYETLSQEIDSLALQYNATEIVDGLRNFMIRFSSAQPNTSAAPQQIPRKSLSEKLRHLQLRFQKSEWKVIYKDFDSLFREFLSVIMTDDLVEKIKGLALQSVDVSKKLLASSTTVLAGSANILFSVTVSIISGAAGVFNFISQLMVFFWLLYYLITSVSGRVMDHVLGMLPISKSTRVRCAEVLDHAVSSVLMATAKVALFQGLLTYLLFRFYQIHFLYTSTFLAWMSAVLPITPTCLSSIPAAAQLAMESRYIEAIILPAIHLILVDYGTTAIKDDIPGQSAYLTGLSILGGIALFPSVLEGAIMGPLLMTVMIALKNLYVEFVLESAKGTFM